jgi:hypothetical protein
MGTWTFGEIRGMRRKRSGGGKREANSARRYGRTIQREPGQHIEQQNMPEDIRMLGKERRADWLLLGIVSDERIRKSMDSISPDISRRSDAVNPKISTGSERF